MGLHVFMCINVNVCLHMYVCINVCVCVSVSLCLFLCVYVNVSVYLSACVSVSVYVWVFACLYICICACGCLCMYVCQCVYVFALCLCVYGTIHQHSDHQFFSVSDTPLRSSLTPDINWTDDHLTWTPERRQDQVRDAQYSVLLLPTTTSLT